MTKYKEKLEESAHFCMEDCFSCGSGLQECKFFECSCNRRYCEDCYLEYITVWSNWSKKEPIY